MKATFIRVGAGNRAAGCFGKGWMGIQHSRPEREDGDVCDRCVFSDRHTLNDHEMVRIRYRKGALARFTRSAFAPEEFGGFCFTGTTSRLEFGTDSVALGKPMFVSAAGEDLPPARQPGQKETVNDEA